MSISLGNSKLFSFLASLLTAVFLLFSGCGGGPNSIPVQPPSGLSYTTALAVYTQGTPIAANSPTSGGGAVASYSVNPTLPAGLDLSATTGIISGTPTTVAAKGSFTVMASNATGSTTASLSITVNVAAPAGLSYAPGTAVYTVDTIIPADSPTSTGGAVASYNVSPPLPAGLNLSVATGIISGTPNIAAATASYAVTASNSTGSTMATLTISVNPIALSSDNINLIFVVSEDLAYQASGDVNPLTANLTNQGLQRSLLLAPFLQQNVLGGENVTGIYALEPATHLQTTATGYYPDMVALETVQQFALLNQITMYTDPLGDNQNTGYSYPLNISYAPGSVPGGVVTPTPSYPCPGCQGLDFDDQEGANEALVNSIVQANVPGFYVFSAPWETTGDLLANLNAMGGYDLSLPVSYQGPNYVYALSIPPLGSAGLATFNSNLNPPSTYPVLPSPGLPSAPCTAQIPTTITVTGGTGGAVIPAGINTNETLYIIRHADAHPTANFADGNYVGAGQWRALGLPGALHSKISPQQVYSIDPAQVTPGYLDASGQSNWSNPAPSLTAEPYAIANNLPYSLVISFLISDSNSPLLASNFFFKGGQLSGQSVLLAWQFVQIPETLNALLFSYYPHGGAPAAPAWSGLDYDTVWTVTLDSVGNLTFNNTLCEGIDSALLPAMAPAF